MVSELIELLDPKTYAQNLKLDGTNHPNLKIIQLAA